MKPRSVVIEVRAEVRSGNPIKEIRETTKNALLDFIFDLQCVEDYEANVEPEVQVSVNVIKPTKK